MVGREWGQKTEYLVVDFIGEGCCTKRGHGRTGCNKMQKESKEVSNKWEVIGTGGGKVKVNEKCQIQRTLVKKSGLRILGLFKIPCQKGLYDPLKRNSGTPARDS